MRRSSTKPNNLFHPQTYPSPTAHALHSPQPGHSSPAPAVPLIPSLRGLQSTNTQQPPSHQYPLNPLLDVLPNLTPPRPSALPPNPILPPIKKPRLTALPPADAGSTSPASQPKPRRDQQQPHPPTHLSMTSFYERRKAEDQRKAVYKRIRKGRKGKGYVRVVTNIGHLNIELHCDKVPMTCDNFLTLAERKYYDGLLWHRVIPGFIAQTGDPTGKGDSGDSAWGGHIKDEIRTTLNHDAPGVVSMANSGRDTNRSQWFISFNAAHHLDGAHTVFGKVVGGLYVLKKMEDEAEMGHPLTVERVEVLVNPIRQIRETMSAANAKPIPIPAPLSSLPSKTPPPQLNSNSSTMLTIPLSPVQTGNCEQLHSRQPPASDQMDYSPVPHSASMSKPTQLPSLHPPPQQRQPPPLSLPRDLPPASTLLTAASIHPQNPTRL